ncbi:pro-neuregulin-1, membrane-bound isoform-like isoform X10 [Branchiostoma lanceolatum]|uniref:pro-neuregulin-1, membrane-bound isoform-like isoform X10 n=1 Tax=Branchiostoma lanceolatum TaxID=7740 RepID=UPI003454F768
MEARIDRVKGALAAAHQRWHREVPLLSDKWLIVPAALILALVCFLVVTLKWIWVDHIFDGVEPTYGHGAVEMAAKGEEAPGMEGPSATVSSDGEGSGDREEQDGRNQGGGAGSNIIPDVILPSVPPLIEPTPTTAPGSISSTIFQFNTIPTQTAFTGHGIPCKDKDAGYCLNEGTCSQIPSAPGTGNDFEKRCTCTDDYVGKRCQYLNPAVYRAQLRRKRSLAFRGAEEIHQKRVLAITGICLALLVVGIMCGVAWYKSRKQRKKWCRKHLMANGQAQGGDAEEPHEGEIMIPMTNLAGGSRTEPKRDLADETSFRNGDSLAPHDNPNGDIGRNQPSVDFQGDRRKRLNGVAKPALSKPSWQSTPNKDRSPRKEFAALPAEPSPIPEPSTPPRLSRERPLPVPDIQRLRQASRESSKEDLDNENTPLRRGSSVSSSGSSLQLDPTSGPVRKPFIREPDDVDLSTEEFQPYDVTDAGDLTPEFTPTNTPRIQRDRDFSNNNPPYISTSRPSDEEDENDNFNATDPDFHARLRNVIENQEAVAV